MNNNQQLENLVSRYLDGEMTDIERLSFEDSLLKNPELQEEYSLQKETLEQLREYRRAELKTRLSNIKVGNTLFYQTNAFKVAASIGITASIATGIYFFSDNEKEYEDLSLVELSTQEEVVPDERIPEKPGSEIAYLEVEDEVISEKNESAEKIVENPSEKSTPTPTINRPVHPDVIEPEVFTDIKEEEALSNDISFKSTTVENINEGVEKAVDVEVVNDYSRKNKLHYKFYNRKLFLFGDFDKEPYRIIELKGNTETNYFLYYEGKYFSLNKDTFKPEALVAIENEQLVRKLDSLRSE